MNEKNMDVKTKNCKSCGAEVVKLAKVCPKCGAKLKMGVGKKILIGIGVFVILGVISSAGSNGTPTPIVATPTPVVASTTPTPVVKPEPIPTPTPDPVIPTPTTIDNPVAKLDSSSVKDSIKSNATAAWGTDYEMIKYDIDKQTTAYNALKEIKVDTKVKYDTMVKAIGDWNKDFEMIKYEYDKQMKAYGSL